MEVIDFNKDKIVKEEFLPYIKPIRKTHHNGFRLFEIGYCKLDETNKVSQKMVLGQQTNHILFYDFPCDKSIYLNMDLTVDGYIRIWIAEPHTMFWEKFGNRIFSLADVKSEEVKSEEVK